MRQSFETVFPNYDNSSSTNVKVIGLKKGRKKKIDLGDLLLVVPKKFKISKEIQKKRKYLGLVIGLKKKIKRKNGFSIASLDNKILLMTFQYKFLGTRVYGGVCKEVRGGANESLFKKIISYSNGSY